jgi:tetratricopeptide (TPR) repeat protein
MSVVGASYAMFNIGEYREAVAVLDHAIELADGDVSMGAGGTFGCPYGYCLMFKGGYVLYLGELEHGRDLIERGIKIARQHGDIESTGWGYMHLTTYSFLAGEPDTALGYAQQSLEIAERIGDALSRAMAWHFLGLAERTRGEWQRAIEAVEHSAAIVRERRTSVEVDAWRLVLLGESHLGLGDPERGRGLIEEALKLARARGQRLSEALSRIALARNILSTGSTDAHRDIEQLLARTLEIGRETEAKTLFPMVYVELAELARKTGDEGRRQRELGEAHRLFTEIGATGHAERLAAELAETATG